MASHLFAEKGFHGTSTRDIAARVEIRQPSLFHHFASKAAIMAELQQSEFETSIRILEAALRHDGSPAARLYCAVFLDVRRMLALPYNFSCTTTAEVLNEPALAEQRALWVRIMDLQSALIVEGVASGELIDLDSDFANRGVDWLIEGALVDASRRANVDATEFADQVASFALRALLADHSCLQGLRAEGLALAEALRTTAGV